MKTLLVLLVAGLIACQPSQAELGSGTPKEHPVTARLVADAAGVAPGERFTIGVLLEMQPHWHVYWKNPGDAGVPVVAELSGTEGMTFGEMAWPLPIRFVQPGDIVGYGYEESVLFPVEVTAPKGIAAGEKLRIAADVSWLTCKDVCIPGGAKLDLEIPVAESGEAANGELFAQWRERLPKTLDATRFEATTSGALEGSPSTGRFEIRLDLRSAPSSVEWFPVVDPALVVEKVTVENDGGRTEIAFSARELSGLTLSADQMETLIVYTNAQGKRHGVVVPVDLRPTKRGGSE